MKVDLRSAGLQARLRASALIRLRLAPLDETSLSRRSGATSCPRPLTGRDPGHRRGLQQSPRNDVDDRKDLEQLAVRGRLNL